MSWTHFLSYKPFRKAGRPKGRPAFFALRGRCGLGCGDGAAKLRVSPMYGTGGAQGVR